MFNRYLFCLTFLCLTYSCAQQEYNISINLNNIDSVYFYHSSSLDDNKILVVNDTMFLVNSVAGDLFYLQKNNLKYYLFLHHSSNIEISYLDSDTVSVTGNDAEFIVFLNKYYNIYKPKIDSLLLQNYSSDQFEISLYSLLVNEVMEFYNNYPLLNTFHIDCQNYFKKMLKYEYLNNLSIHLLNQKKDTSQVIPFYTDVNIELLDQNLFKKHASDTSCYNLDSFQNYLFNSAVLFVLHDCKYMTEKNNNFHNFSISFFQFINNEIPKSAWKFIFKKYIYNYARFINKNTVSYMENFLTNHNFDQKTITYLLDFYNSLPQENYLIYKEDNMIPDASFYLEDIRGDIVSLNDFKGKILYIDIWASWCGPCRQQFPHAEKLKSNLSKRQLKKINFIYISIDNDHDKWQKSLDALNLTGYQFISPANKSNGAGQYFNVSSIPRYILIDANGDIINNNAKRPSDSSLLSELLELIK